LQFDLDQDSRYGEIMSNDDSLEGNMSRRRMLAVLGLTGMNMLAGYSPSVSASRDAKYGTLSCVVTPQQTEGPYFVDEQLHRSDIRSDPSDGSVNEGLPLTLEIGAFVVGTVDKSVCTPLPGAIVDIWQCDAHGVYSDVMDEGFNTIGKKFLRGYQVTDAEGKVKFVTIYPGWYPGRTPHIHFKIRTGPGYEQSREFTSQFYFDDKTSDAVYARPPYNGRKERRARTKNEEDGIFRRGGNQLMLALTQAETGYVARYEVGLDMTSIGSK
jgi:protocatechuate 3,4-dioxygenase beta subunit